MVKISIVDSCGLSSKSFAAEDYIFHKISDTVMQEIKSLHKRREHLQRQLRNIDEQEARILAVF